VPELKRTPLYETHLEEGGRIIDFGGWALPVEYSGIIAEHRAVRSSAGLFDVSHMGEILVSGPGALEFLNYALTNDLSSIVQGQVMYSPMANEEGGTVDDLLVYRLAGDAFLLVVNAANTEKDYSHLRLLAAERPGVEVEDVSDRWAELALQGPRAEDVLRRLTDFNLGDIRYYYFAHEVSVAGVSCLVSRTGYTGEDGFELYCEPADAAALWRAIRDAGGEDVIPAGLGARDTLRLEAGMPLYGHELGEDISPLDAGLGRFVAQDKDFVGREAMLKGSGRRRLVAFEMTERGIPRQGHPLIFQGEEVGVVTSGTYSPWLNKSIGMGFVPPDLASPGQVMAVSIRGRQRACTIVKRPFVKGRRKT